MKIVEITYEDICQFDNQCEDCLDKLEAIKLKAVGFLYKKDKKYYKIIFNYDLSEKEHDTMLIPIGCVLKVRNLK